MIWPFLLQATSAGFALSFEPTARGTFIVRARPTFIRVDRPATVRFAGGLSIEKASIEDAAAHILQCVCGALELDAEERRLRERLASDEEPRFSGARDNRAPECAEGAE